MHNKAYPNQEDQTHLIRRFAIGLRKKEVRNYTLRAMPATYEAALAAAQNEQSVLHMANCLDLGRVNPDAMDVSAIQKGRSGAQSKPGFNKSASYGGAKPKGKCNYCHKPGHFARDCFSLNKAKNYFSKMPKGGAAIAALQIEDVDNPEGEEEDGQEPEEEELDPDFGGESVEPVDEERPVDF